MIAHDARCLRIAIIGSRGVPATWGGVERHVEEVTTRLAARGHEVTVFCRDNYSDGNGNGNHDYAGVHRRSLPTVSRKHLDAIIHSTFSSVVALRGFDIVHYQALGPGLPAPIVRYGSRAKVVLTVHGLDGQRGKWGLGARMALQTAERMSAHVPDATVVVSRALAEHYLQAHNRATNTIVNGVCEKDPLPAGAALKRLGLAPRRYVLFVGRLVPEKAPDLLVRAFRAMKTDASLVLVGGSSFTDGFSSEVHQLAASDPRIKLPGYLYGEQLRELYSNAGLFVLPSLLEGMPLTLLEAASYGLPIVASGIPPHVEVLESSGPGGRLVVPGDQAALQEAIGAALENLPAERVGARRLRRRVLSQYSWDAATVAHENLYLDLLNGGARRHTDPELPTYITLPPSEVTVPVARNPASVTVGQQRRKFAG